MNFISEKAREYVKTLLVALNCSAWLLLLGLFFGSIFLQLMFGGGSVDECPKLPWAQIPIYFLTHLQKPLEQHL